MLVSTEMSITQSQIIQISLCDLFNFPLFLFSTSQIQTFYDPWLNKLHPCSRGLSRSTTCCVTSVFAFAAFISPAVSAEMRRGRGNHGRESRIIPMALWVTWYSNYSYGPLVIPVASTSKPHSNRM